MSFIKSLLNKNNEAKPLDQDFDEEQEMSFFDHIDELRSHIIRSLIVLILVTIVIFFNKKIVFDNIVLAPKSPDFLTYKLFCRLSAYLNSLGLKVNICISSISYELKNIDMSGQFMTHIKVSIVIASIIAFPYIFYEFWKFIRPALHINEIKKTRGITFFASILFIVGSLFGYFLLAPFSMNFLGSYTVSDSVQNEINLDSYIGMLMMMVLASALIFELPILIYFLSKIGLITAAFMRNYRRYAYIIILVVAAILTPSPDVFSQLILAIPLVILYEISIFIALRNEKHQVN